MARSRFFAKKIGSATIIYAVSAIAQGVDAHHIVLTVADMGASAAVGVKVKYIGGPNGAIQDPAGNPMATTITGITVSAW